MATASATLKFLVPHARSLKDKRMVARAMIDKARHKYNASIAEVETQDAHQILTVEDAVVSGEVGHAREMLDNIVRFMEGNTEAVLLAVERERGAYETAE